MELGISPRRFLGEEPKVITRYHYDDQGRIAYTVETREPEWDAHNRAVVAAYLDYRTELHSCGRPLSEALHVEGRPDPDYVVGELTCTACAASDRYVKKHHPKDGLPSASVMQVYSRAEAQAIARRQREGG